MVVLHYWSSVSTYLQIKGSSHLKLDFTYNKFASFVYFVSLFMVLAQGVCVLWNNYKNKSWQYKFILYGCYFRGGYCVYVSYFVAIPEPMSTCFEAVTRVGCKNDVYGPCTCTSCAGGSATRLVCVSNRTAYDMCLDMREYNNNTSNRLRYTRIQ